MTNQRKRSISVAFKVDAEEYSDHIESDANENLTKPISLIPKSFSKVMRIHDKISRRNVTSNVKDNQ